MNTSSVLVYAPGLPFSPATLMPKQPLAALAGLLEATGHQTCIADYGTLGALSQLVPEDISRSLAELAEVKQSDSSLDPLDALACRWQARDLDRRLLGNIHHFCLEAATSLMAVTPLDFVVFYLEKGPGLYATGRIAAALRERRPEVKLFGWGPQLGLLGADLLREWPQLDCICCGTSSRDMLALAEQASHPDRWAATPNLVLAHGREVIETTWAPNAPSPCHPDGYASNVYPAMEGDQLLKLVTVEAGRGCSHACHPCDGARSEVQTRDPQSVCDELVACQRALGAQYFHLRGLSRRPKYAESVAHSLLHRGLSVRYSHTGCIEQASPAAFSMLWASGCRAADFRIETGSQRLLDRVYGRQFGVTQAEHVVRACKAANIFTTARFTYPCPSDDYHTLDETLRFLSRTHPDGVDVTLPELVPGSAWFQEPANFEFEALTGRQVARYWTELGAYPARALCLPQPPGRVGTRAAWAAAEENLALQREVCRRGLIAPSDGRLALIAAACGYEHREGEFFRLVQRMFQSGDVAEIACLTERFNAAALAPALHAGRESWGSLDLAVGN